MDGNGIVEQYSRLHQDPDVWRHPTGDVPEVVHVVCLGQSLRNDYVNYALRKGDHADARFARTEVWTVNRGVRLVASDLAFVMDEIEQEAKADASYGQALAAYPGPIITSIPSEKFPRSVRYPSRFVLDTFGIPEGADPYWHNSVPMVLAYAAAVGVGELVLWGADYTLPNGRVLEDDRACCEYWLGRITSHGVRVGLPDGTTLMNRQKHSSLYVYGLCSQAGAAEWLAGGARTMTGERSC